MLRKKPNKEPVDYVIIYLMACGIGVNVFLLIALFQYIKDYYG